MPVLRIKDETVVIAASAPHWLELRARARPFPSARIKFELRPEGEGTRVTMVENVDNALLNVLAGPMTHFAMRLRNQEALRRLKALAEGTRKRPRGRLKSRQTTAHT
jgi:hypothetical protein